MREGIGRDGRALFPQMPYLTYRETLSDDDALAIIAYLRTLAAGEERSRQDRGEVSRSRCSSAAPRSRSRRSPPPRSVAERQDGARQVAAPGVLLQRLPRLGRTSKMQKIPGKALAGGLKFPLPNGKGTRSRRTSRATRRPASAPTRTRISAASFDEGKGKTGRYLYVMPWSYYGGMTKEDKDALIAALRGGPRGREHRAAPSRDQRSVAGSCGSAIFRVRSISWPARFARSTSTSARPSGSSPRRSSRRYADEWEEAELFPNEVFKRAGELGIFGAHYPEEHGGAGGDYWFSVAKAEELPQLPLGRRVDGPARPERHGDAGHQRPRHEGADRGVPEARARAATRSPRSA